MTHDRGWAESVLCVHGPISSAWAMGGLPFPSSLAVGTAPWTEARPVGLATAICHDDSAPSDGEAQSPRWQLRDGRKVHLFLRHSLTFPD